MVITMQRGRCGLVVLVLEEVLSRAHVILRRVRIRWIVGLRMRGIGDWCSRIGILRPSLSLLALPALRLCGIQSLLLALVCATTPALSDLELPTEVLKRSPDTFILAELAKVVFLWIVRGSRVESLPRLVVLAAPCCTLPPIWVSPRLCGWWRLLWRGTISSWILSWRWEGAVRGLHIARPALRRSWNCGCSGEVGR